MKARYLITILALLSIVLYACSSDKTGAAVIEENKTAEKINTKQVECDDNNKCTKDSYDQVNDKCINEPLKDCCGNKICENNEGCNTITYNTKCKEDCGLSCGANIVFGDGVCADDKCVKDINGDFTLSADSRIKFSLHNNGEQSTDVSSTLECKRKVGGSYNGYFNDNKGYITISPGQTGHYYVEIKRVEGFSMECEMTLSGGNFVNFGSFRVKG